MRMRGLEPPPGCPDTDLNRARLPIPPHPRADAKISQRAGASGIEVLGGRPQAPRAGVLGTNARACFASLEADRSAPLSSRGLGRRPLMAETRVRIPVAVLVAPLFSGRFGSQGVARWECPGFGARRALTAGLPSLSCPRHPHLRRGDRRLSSNARPAAGQPPSQPLPVALAGGLAVTRLRGVLRPG
jgi:hypothetical protein